MSILPVGFGILAVNAPLFGIVPHPDHRICQVSGNPFQFSVRFPVGRPEPLVQNTILPVPKQAGDAAHSRADTWHAQKHGLTQ